MHLEVGGGGGRYVNFFWGGEGVAMCKFGIFGLKIVLPNISCFGW